MKRLREIKRNIYGHDRYAINRHSERVFEDEGGNLFVLSRTLDGCPPFFEAYGPYRKEHEGALPRLKVEGQEYWGDGWTWPKAEESFCRELNAGIKRERVRK